MPLFCFLHHPTNPSQIMRDKIRFLVHMIWGHEIKDLLIKEVLRNHLQKYWLSINTQKAISLMEKIILIGSHFYGLSEKDALNTSIGSYHSLKNYTQPTALVGFLFNVSRYTVFVLYFSVELTGVTISITVLFCYYPPF